MNLKTAGWWGLGLAVVFGLGWFVGASGRSALDQERRAALSRAEFAEARALVLDGRVSVFQQNFGNAGRAFEAARQIIEQTQTRLRQLGDAARAGQLEVAVSQLREAERLAKAVDAAAGTAAAQALGVIDAVSSSAMAR